MRTVSNSAPTSPLLVPSNAANPTATASATTTTSSSTSTSPTALHEHEVADFFPYTAPGRSSAMSEDVFRLELFPIEAAQGEEYLSDRRVFSDFLQSHKCYDMVPASGKIVVLHTGLTLNAAFHALIENGMTRDPCAHARSIS